MIDAIPTEIPLDSIYFPPAFFMVAGGFVGAWGISRLLNLIGASRFFWHPALAFLALWILASSLLGLTVIPP